MFKSRDNLSPSCSSSEELVAYLYDEMNAAGRSVLEDHLSGCDLCASELADLSFARLDVYEWHRDEFKEMATPPIVIPYGETARSSWFDAVRAFFASPMQLATAGGAFAVLVIAAGVWFLSPRVIDTAHSVPTPSPVVVISNKPVENPQKEITSTAGNDNLAREPESLASTSGTEAVKTSVTEKSVKPSNPRPAKTQQNKAQPARARRNTAPPRLNDFDDEDDNTLRLGDLLAEIDTRD